MLTEQEKDQIRLEEHYRHDVRRQLDDKADKPTGHKVWTFLNSAFFLWFLSSVIIGLVSLGYTRWEARRAEEKTRRDQRSAIEQENRVARKKLDAEISTRLVYIHSITYRAHVISSDPLSEALTVLERPAESKFPVNVIPEYSTRSIHGLLLELIEVLPDETDKERIQEAYTNSLVFQLQYTMTTLNSAEVRSRKIKEGEMLDRCNFYNLMSTSFNLARWGQPFRPKHSDCFPQA